MNEMLRAAENAIALARPKAGERCLIVTDANKINIAEVLLNAAAEKCETVMMVMPTATRHREEPPKFVADAMKKFELVYCPTTYSLSHTDARKKATEAGARIATLPGITEKSFIRGMSADYGKVKELSLKMLGAIKGVKKVKIKAEGTKLDLDITARKRNCGFGDLNYNSFVNLPEGELYVSPLDANGYLTVQHDGETIPKGTKLTIKNCKVTNQPAIMKKYKNANNVAEFGIGTNPSAELGETTLESEKKYGTIHVAFGDSHTFGGDVTAEVHWDVVIEKPTVEFDGKVVIMNGKWRI